MKYYTKSALTLIVILTVSGCTSENNINEVYIEQIKQNQTSEFKVSEKQGATISFKLNFDSVPSPNNEFRTKANTNGSAAKTSSDVDHYIVYLIKDNSTTGFPDGGDPLNASAIVAGPFNITNSGASSKTVKFANVPPLATGAYYIAVKAQDSSNNDIIKDNNGGTAWTGTTASNPKVAVSSGNGVTVNSSYVVSSNSPAVSINLLNAVGARIDANIIPNSGSIDTVTNSILQDYITTIAGTGGITYGGDNGQATSAQLNNPYQVAADSSGNIYIADYSNNRIRKVNSSGIITTFAGNGTAGFAGDNGQATSAQLNYPSGVEVDSSGNVYIADTSNNRIRKVNSSGIITTVAGSAANGFAGDTGQATSAQLNSPSGVEVDSSGNIYIADYGNKRIRKVNSSGIITTIAGTGTAGYSGDNGQATSAQLNNPYQVAIDSSGNVYIADTSNNRIRKVNSSGIITTFAGNGTAGFAGDNGQATNAKLNTPYGVEVDSSGNIYIADLGNNRIRKVNSSGIIITIAGNGTAGFAGDNGQATSAQLNSPSGVEVDSSGNIYIADYGNNRIRKIYKN